MFILIEFFIYITKPFNFAIHFYIKNKNLISYRGTDKKHSKKIKDLFWTQMNADFRIKKII